MKASQYSRWAASAALVICASVASCAMAQSKNRAPGFDALPKTSTLVIMPPDIELFELSAGGVPQPRADWSDAAFRHFKTALARQAKLAHVKSKSLTEEDVDDIAELNALHAAVARAIAMHHFGASFLHLPTKEEKLDWSLGDSVTPLRQKTGADYAFFSWIRDSYASAERIATMVALAVLGIGVGGGTQVGYASLIDLRTGQVVWFNQLVRASGDLRETEKAAETLEALLENFPGTK